MAYELIEGPADAGQGEFVRLALEAAGAPYTDVSRAAGGAAGRGPAAWDALLRDRQLPTPPLDSPVLRDGALLLGQPAAILHHLAPTLKLVARSELSRALTQQIQLTLEALLHGLAPLQAQLGPDDAAVPSAELRAQLQRWVRDTLPRTLVWCETLIARNPAGTRHLVAGKLSYADLSLFQLIEGLRHAAPAASARVLAATPLLLQLHRRVAELPRVRAYLKSERRAPFSAHGLFRAHPALDAA